MFDAFVTKYRLWIIAILGALVAMNQQYPVIPAAYITYVGAALAFFTILKPPTGQKFTTIHESAGPDATVEIPTPTLVRKTVPPYPDTRAFQGVPNP